VSGEFHYLYHDGHPFLEAPGVKADIQGQSHTLTCELLFHFKTAQHRWRPYLAGGTGAKEYVIAGPEPFPQPIPQIASLTTNDVWKTVFSLGGGVKFRPRPHVLLRAEFRDYLTTFPRTQTVPAPHNTARGIFQQFTPTVGVAYAF
jgi:opacity protein-like surface antigen